MVMLQRWSLSWREKGHVTEVVSLMEGEWSCYRSGHFYEGIMFMSTEMASLMEGAWSCYRCGHFNEW